MEQIIQEQNKLEKIIGLKQGGFLNSDIAEQLGIKISSVYTNLKNAGLEKNKTYEERIKSQIICGLLDPYEKDFVANALKDDVIKLKGKSSFFDPDLSNRDIYYISDGFMIEYRLKTNSVGKEIELIQDLLFDEEIIGRRLINNKNPTYWDPIEDVEMIRISPEKERELIRNIPGMKNNFECLRDEKIYKLDDLSNIRSGVLAEERVKDAFNFVLNKKVVKTLNGPYSHKKVFLNQNNQIYHFGNYSDYGISKKDIKYEYISKLACISRETLSRTIHANVFQSNGKNYKIAFLEKGNLFICKYLDNPYGKIIKLNNLKE